MTALIYELEPDLALESMRMVLFNSWILEFDADIVFFGSRKAVLFI